MSTKTLTPLVLALLMGVLTVGCASDTTVTYAESTKYTESTKETDVATIKSPKDEAKEMRLYVRSVLMAYILKGQYSAAYTWQIPEHYSGSVRRAGEEERAFIFETELYPRWSEASLRALRSQVDEILADKSQSQRFVLARETIWLWPKKGCEPVDELVRKGRTEIMNTVVNVAHWKILEAGITKKVTALIAEEKYKEAREFLNKIKPIRSYTKLFDEHIDAVCATLTTLGIPEEKLLPMKEEASALIVEAFKDATEAYESSISSSGSMPDFSEYEASLERLREVLVKYDCAEAKADGVVAAIQKAVAPLLAEYCVGNVTSTSSTFLTELGTTQLNEKLKALIAEFTAQIDAAEKAKMLADIEAAMKEKAFADARQWAIFLNRSDLLAEALIAEVRQHVANRDWEAARTCIRDYVDFGCAEIDIAIYLIRIGLLNSEVNPAQKEAMLEEMLATYAEMVEAGDLLATREWLVQYPFVIDAYPEIDTSMGDMSKAIEALGVDKALIAEAMTAERAAIQILLDNRVGSYAEPIDINLVKVDEALLVFAESLIDQSNDEYDALARIAKIRNFAKAAAEAAHVVVPITTAQLNAALVLQRDALLKELDIKIAIEEEKMAEEERRQAYARLLDALDKEVGIETQITIAEDAIVRGLPTVSMGLHTVLGDYARAFRLLKNKATLTDEQKASILVGAAYLNQPTVVAWACDLGADINAVAPRDPLARPAVLVAIQAGNAAVIRAAVAADADMTVADANGDTALHYAVRVGDANIINLVLDTADVNAVNKEGSPAIFIAAVRNQTERVAQLIAAGANLELANAKGYTVMDMACVAGARDVLDTLAASDAPISDNALILAVANDRLAVTQWLVERGADVNAPGVMEEAKGATVEYLISQGGRPQEKTCLTKTLYFPEELKQMEAAEAEALAKTPEARKAEAEAQIAENAAKKLEAEVKKLEAEAKKLAAEAEKAEAETEE